MRTLKQKWAFERCFRQKGSLASILSNLSQIANAKSTLHHEGRELADAHVAIARVLRFWDSCKEESWKRFERRSK